MCVILYNEKGTKLNRNLLEIAYENNPHGVGFMWLEDGRINILKGLYDFNQIWQVSKMFEGFTYAMHLRWRTKGSLAEEQCHPFSVLEKDKDGIDLSVMHNGTIFSMPNHKNKSDTQIFSEKLREKILEKDPSYSLDYFDQLEKTVGRLNKMIFMTSDNRTFFINKDCGLYIDDVWYSNDYSLKKHYRNDKVEIKENVIEKYTKSYGKIYEKYTHQKPMFNTRIRKGKIQNDKNAFYL